MWQKLHAVLYGNLCQDKVRGVTVNREDNVAGNILVLIKRQLAGATRPPEVARGVDLRGRSIPSPPWDRPEAGIPDRSCMSA